MRQVYHALRAEAIECWHSQLKRIFALSGQLPARGLFATPRFVLSAVLTCQVVLLDRFVPVHALRAGLQAALQAAAALACASNRRRESISGGPL